MKYEDLLHSDEPDSLQKMNLLLLLPALNRLEALYGKPFVVTSAFRSWKEHKAIYQALNDKRLIAGKCELPIPLHSQHLMGNAADIYDPEGLLKTWVEAHVSLLEEEGLWCEDFGSTPNWVHFQRVPPKSKKRFFIPF